MTDADDHELINLAYSIDEVRRDFFRNRDHLQRVLTGLAREENAIGRLVTAAEEFGIEETMARLERAPTAFGCEPVPPAQLALLSDVLDAVVSADAELGRLVGAREAILCTQDPSRQRRYNMDGREAILDVDARTMRYVDDDRVSPLEVEVVEPTGILDKDRFAAEREAHEASQKSRRRDRDR